MAPNTFKQWILRDANGLESLHLSSATIPSTIGDYDVLVNLHFASLNYRDILIAQASTHLLASLNDIHLPFEVRMLIHSHRAKIPFR